MRANRRKFLAAVAGSTVACGGRKSPWRFFTIDEARTVEAVCERIVPADQDPGAARAGVVHFIDRQLAGFHRGFQQTYRAGIAEVERISTQRFGAPFSALSPNQQNAILAEMEQQRAPFFDAIVSHTMQGFYGSPRHGGNRDAVSWTMLGIAYPPVRGRV